MNLCVNCCLGHSEKCWTLTSKKCLDLEGTVEQETLVDLCNYFSRCLRLWILFICNCVKILRTRCRALCCGSLPCWHAPHPRRSFFSWWTIQSQQTSKAAPLGPICKGLFAVSRVRQTWTSDAQFLCFWKRVSIFASHRMIVRLKKDHVCYLYACTIPGTQ